MSKEKALRPTKRDLEETIEELYGELRAANKELGILRLQNERLTRSTLRQKRRFDELRSYVTRLRDWAQKNGRKGA